MKRRTIIAINGNDAYILSCAETVKPESASIIIGLKHGHVVVTGKGVVHGDKIKHVIDTNGNPMISPNRATRVKLMVVEERRSFASLLDIAPEALKSKALDPDAGRTVRIFGNDWPVKVNERGTEYIEPVKECDNPGCGGKIKGKCRVNGDRTQGFQPYDKKVVNQGHYWYCGCTTKPPIPEQEKKKEIKVEAPVIPITITMSGSIAEIKAAMKKFIEEV